ncbi:MAG: hypothetical protein J7K83_03905 [Candidatus Aenigmarchaeota archaeon]|nr:hypothetical protein [Candidatus Aenigmarchaeota archaeon]
MKKGVVTFIELVVVGIILITSFTLFFSQKTSELNYGLIKTKVIGYDFLVSRYGYNNNLYSSFVENRTPNEYDDEMRSIWTFSSYSLFIDGIVPYNVQVACNCTNETILELNNLFSAPVNINGRNVHVTFVYSEVPHIGSLEPISPGDLLLIWGCMDNNVYINRLKGYLLSGKGIINVCDADSTVITRDVYKEIFGLVDSSPSSATTVTIDKPNSAYEPVYQPKKFFFEVNEQPTFTSTPTWSYAFNNFLIPSVTVAPNSDFFNRSIVYADSSHAGATVNYFGKGGYAIWTANFARKYSSLQNMTDAEKKFLLSLILAAADKRGIPDIRYRVKGIPIYYFDAVGKDVFEPYRAVFALYL